MIGTITKAWPVVRRGLIWFGAANALISVLFWLNNVESTVNNFFVFVALVVFLLGAKANDDTR